MPFAEFTPASPALALPQLQLQSQDAAASLMERAQRLRQSQEIFPLQKAALATNLALTQQEVAQKQLEYRVASTIHSVDLTNKQADTQRAQLDADAATAHATLAGQTLTANLLTQLPDEVNRLFSTATVPADTGGDFYGTYRNTLAAVNAFKARFGGVISGSNSPGLHDLLGKVQLIEANANASWQNHVLASFPDLQSRVAKAQTTSDISALQADPLFSSAAAIFPKLDEAVKSRFESLTKDEQEQRTHENTLKRQQEGLKNEQQMLKQKSTVTDPEFGGVAPTPESAQKVRDSIAVYRTSKDALDKLDAVLKTVVDEPSKSLSPELRGEAVVLQQQLVSAIGRLQIGGVLSDSEAQTMKTLVPNPTDLRTFNSASAGKLKMLRQELEVRMTETAAANGISRGAAPASTAPAIDSTDEGTFQAAMRARQSRSAPAPTTPHRPPAPGKMQ